MYGSIHVFLYFYSDIHLIFKIFISFKIFSFLLLRQQKQSSSSGRRQCWWRCWGSIQGNAHRLLFPSLRIALLPLHRHHRRHQGRDGQLEMGRLRRRLHHAPGMGSISPGLPDRKFVHLASGTNIRNIYQEHISNKKRMRVCHKSK